MYALAAAFALAAVLCSGGCPLLRHSVGGRFFQGSRRVSVSELRLSSTTRRRVFISRISYIICAALALYTHVFTALVIAAVNVHAFWQILHGHAAQAADRSSRRIRSILLGRWMLLQFGVLLLYAIWLHTFLYQVLVRPRQGWRPPLEPLDLGREFLLFCGRMVIGQFVYPQDLYYALKNLSGTLWNSEALIEAPRQSALFPLAVTVGLLGLISGTRAVRGLPPTLFYFPLALTTGILPAIRQRMELSRYLMLLSPYYFLLVAAGLAQVKAPLVRLSLTLLLGLSMGFG